MAAVDAGVVRLLALEGGEVAPIVAARVLGGGEMIVERPLELIAESSAHPAAAEAED